MQLHVFWRGTNEEIFFNAQIKCATSGHRIRPNLTQQPPPATEFAPPLHSSNATSRETELALDLYFGTAAP